MTRAAEIHTAIHAAMERVGRRARHCPNCGGPIVEVIDADRKTVHVEASHYGHGCLLCRCRLDEPSGEMQ